MTGSFELIQNERAQLILRRPDHDDVVDVRVRRAFPWSSKQRYVSIRSSDGKELVFVEDLGALPPNQRQLIEHWLASTSFIPTITRVHSVDVRFGFQQWKVDTDRGPTEFRVQEREDIRFLHDGRFSIKDADGNVYELQSLLSLDEDSRKAVESVI
jgi:hypothetical protein